MTPAQFKAWRRTTGWTQQQAGEALGISRGSVDLYERGARREDQRPVVIPRTVELACAAIAAGIFTYDGPTEEQDQPGHLPQPG